MGLRAEVRALDRLVHSKIEAEDEKVALALAAADKAQVKADFATEKRFDGINEFRQTLLAQASTFATKSTMDAQFAATDAQFDALREKIEALSAQVAKLLISLLTTIVGVLLAALVLAYTR